MSHLINTVSDPFHFYVWIRILTVAKIFTGSPYIKHTKKGLFRYFEAETNPRIKHTKKGLLSMVNCGDGMLGSQFFFTLGT